MDETCEPGPNHDILDQIKKEKEDELEDGANEDTTEVPYNPNTIYLPDIKSEPLEDDDTLCVREQDDDTVEPTDLSQKHQGIEVVKEEIDSNSTDQFPSTSEGKSANELITVKDASNNRAITHEKDTNVALNFDGEATEKLSQHGMAESPLSTRRDGKRFVCEFCDKKFARKAYLTVHLFAHYGVKPFICEFCGKKFSQRGALKVHSLTHSGEKPFACEYCDKKFSQRGNLSAHLLIHSGEKPFTCDYCDKKFSQRSNLKVHLLTHSGKKPFACDFCDKKFSQRETLKSHLFTHSGEKPIACELCDMKFSHRNSLRVHLVNHNVASPFTCEMCGKTFSQKHSLKRHVTSLTCEKARYLNPVNHLHVEMVTKDSLEVEH